MTLHSCTPCSHLPPPAPSQTLLPSHKAQFPLGFHVTWVCLYLYLLTFYMWEKICSILRHLPHCPLLSLTFWAFLSPFITPLQFILCEYLNLGPEYERGVHLHLFESGLFPLTWGSLWFHLLSWKWHDSVLLWLTPTLLCPHTTLSLIPSVDVHPGLSYILAAMKCSSKPCIHLAYMTFGSQALPGYLGYSVRVHLALREMSTPLSEALWPILHSYPLCLEFEAVHTLAGPLCEPSPRATWMIFPNIP